MGIFDDDFGFSNTSNQTYEEYIMSQLKRILQAVVDSNEIPAKVAKFIYESATESSGDRRYLIKAFKNKYDMYGDQKEAAAKVLLPYIKKGIVAFKKRRQRSSGGGGWSGFDTGLNDNNGNGGWDVADIDDDDDDDIIETTAPEQRKEKEKVKKPKKEENLVPNLSEEELAIIEAYKENPIETLHDATTAGMSRINISGICAMTEFCTAVDPTTRITYQLGLSKLIEPMFSTTEIVGVLNEYYKAKMSNYFSIIQYDEYCVIDEKYNVVTSAIKEMYDAFSRGKIREMIDIFQSQSYNFVTCLEKYLIDNINEYLARYLKLDHKTVTIKITEISDVNDLAGMIMESGVCKQLIALEYSGLNEIVNTIVSRALADFIRDPDKCILDPNKPEDRHLIIMNPHYVIRKNGYHEKMHFESMSEEDQKKFLNVIKSKTVMKVPREMIITDINNKALENHLIGISNKRRHVKEGTRVVAPMENDNPFATFVLTKFYKEPQYTGYSTPGIVDIYHINNRTNKFFITKPGLTLRSNLITVT